LTVYPNPSCTGVSTAFSGSGSVSPDGIKSYAFRIIDLWAAIQQDAVDYPQFPIDSEGTAEIREGEYVGALGVPNGCRPDPVNQCLVLHDVQWLIDHFAGAPVVTAQPTITETFNWNRAAIYDPTIAAVSDPSTLARDPVGVVLDVTDYAGHTAQAFTPLSFAQFLSSESRAACGTPQRSPFVSKAVLQARVLFRGSQPSTTVRCRSREACVGAITVMLRGRSPRALDAAQAAPSVLATGFFSIPAHKKGKLSLELTTLGQRLLHPAARLPVTVAVSSVSPTGQSVTHSYSRVLKRR
jgi:hypothetical protein